MNEGTDAARPLAEQEAPVQAHVHTYDCDRVCFAHGAKAALHPCGACSPVVKLDPLRAEVWRVLSEGPGRIKAAAYRVLRTQEQLEGAEKELAKRRNAIYESVCLARAEHTGELLYTNDKARAAATDQRLEADTVGHANDIRARQLRLDQAEQRVELDEAERTWASARSKALLLGGDGR